ncbi:MAG: DNA repair protein RadC [Candidatus Omnitrophica bacterium]|nr:DNA repair protein RadC [Candidatus Omnitrophota bacterium]
MTRQNLTIRDLPRIERPREKLIKYGASRLSNIELLAILLRTGKQGESVLAFAARFLRLISLEKITDLSFEEFRKVSGIGPAKACELLSCVELGRRIFEHKKAQISQLLSPEDVFNNLKDVRLSKKEHFVVFFLDSRNQEIKREIISVGTINASLVHPREVFEPAVKYLAVQIILAHNHPSGTLEPSEDDLAVNKRLTEAGKILGIEVLDHIIVTKDSFISFKEKGLL